MISGLQIYGSDGGLELDIQDNLTRELGSVYTGTENGSLVVPELASGRPWHLLISDYGNRGDFYCPDVVISGTTLSWYFSRRFRSAATLIYGVW